MPGHRAAQQRYARANPDAIYEKNRRWRENNPEKHQASSLGSRRKRLRHKRMREYAMAAISNLRHNLKAAANQREASTPPYSLW